MSSAMSESGNILLWSSPRSSAGVKGRLCSFARKQYIGIIGKPVQQINWVGGWGTWAAFHLALLSLAVCLALYVNPKRRDLCSPSACEPGMEIGILQPCILELDPQWHGNIQHSMCMFWAFVQICKMLNDTIDLKKITPEDNAWFVSFKHVAFKWKHYTLYWSIQKQNHFKIVFEIRKKMFKTHQQDDGKCSK